MLKLRLSVVVFAIVSVSLVFCASSSCTRAVPALPTADDEPVTARNARSEARARIVAAAMSDEELVGQAMIIGVDGVGELSNGSRAILSLVRPGAVILFGFNVAEDPRSVASLAADIRSAAGVPALADGAALPPFVAIDHEGGAVFRFKGGLTRLPPARTMGRAGAAAAAAAGAAAGSELRAVGVTMNAAPVVEALTQANRAFLADRAWSDDPATSGRLAAAFIEACQSSGAAAVAKHFPGNAAADPHRGLPVLDVSRAALEGAFLAPFRRAVDAGVSAIMLSHALVPAIDPGLPVSLSPLAIALLKDELGFRGIVLTDDLQMAALSGRGGGRHGDGLRRPHGPGRPRRYTRRARRRAAFPVAPGGRGRQGRRAEAALRARYGDRNGSRVKARRPRRYGSREQGRAIGSDGRAGVIFLATAPKT